MAPNQSVRPLAPEIVERLTADPKPDSDRDLLVLAALDGPDALASYIDGSVQPARPEPQTKQAASREPIGAYIKTLTIEGVRGVPSTSWRFTPSGSGRSPKARATSAS